MKTWVIVILAIFGVLAIGVVGCAVIFANVLQGPSKAADAWLAQISKGEYRKAYENSSPRFKELSSYEDFQDFVKIARLEKNKVALWRSTQINNDSALLQGEVQRMDSSAFPAECHLRKINGVWKVEGLFERK